MNKKTFLIVALAGLLIGAVGGVLIQEHFQKIAYDVEENPLIVAYTDVPLNFGTLEVDQPYEYDDTNTVAIQTLRDMALNVSLNTIDETHFSEFTVNVWNVTDTPYTLVGSFDMTNTYLVFTTGPANYSYIFHYTIATGTPHGTTGQIELKVTG